jgi:two-component system response regulator WspF
VRLGLVTARGALVTRLHDAAPAGADEVVWVSPTPTAGELARVDLVLVDTALPTAVSLVRGSRDAGARVAALAEADKVNASFAALTAGAADVIDPEMPVAAIAQRIHRLVPAVAPRLVALGASTGGPAALARVLADLPHRHLAFVVGQHLDPAFSTGLAEYLARASGAAVRVAEPGDRPTAGTCLLAHGTAHLELSPTGIFRYTADPSATHVPSVDRLFTSLARGWRTGGAAAILTGMGEDGALGLLALRRAGWATFAQDEGTSAVFGMPRAAAQAGAAAQVLPIGQVGAAIAALLASVTPAGGPWPG